MTYTSPFPAIEIPIASLHEHLFEHAHQWADKPALIDGPTGRHLTYTELRHAVAAGATGLQARGFKQGDVFAIFSPNIPEYAVAFFGVSTAGGINTTINPLYTAEEVKRQLTDSTATFLVTIPQFLPVALEAVQDTSVKEVFVFGEADGATPFSALLSEQNELDVVIDPCTDLVALPYSSGTTGLPKGVMLTHYNLVANLQQTTAVEKITPDDTLIGILPFYHIYGMTVIMGAALRSGATIVTMPRFDLEQFLGLLQQHRVTVAYLVPPIILALAKHPLVDQYDISTLGNVMSGAAPLPESIAQEAARRNDMVVRQGYGLTETSPVTHTNARDMQLKIDSVGTALPNTEWRIIDVDSKLDAVEGELGEVWIRGPQVMTGYLGNPQATHDMIDSEGWLHTGDIGKADSDGYLYVVDRLKELIKYKGFQVAPAELEAVIQSHPAVADAAVIPSPDDEAGEVPKAFVVLRDETNTTADALMTYVASKVAPHKKIRRLEFIDAIPKVPSGKILRRELVARERNNQLKAK